MNDAYHIITTDDDPAIRKILQIILSKEGFKVSVCDSGEALLSLLTQTVDHIDLIILDIKMPGISGLDLLTRLKKDYPLIPVIMLTAFTDLDTGMQAIRNGAIDYLSKPVRKQDLLDCVNAVLKKSTELHAAAEAQMNLSKIQVELKKELNEAYHTILRTTMMTIEAFSETIEQKDVYTKGHCSRVRDISLRIASYLDISESDKAILEGGALLHDIGKIGVPEVILNKPGRLTDDEYTQIKTHPETGEKILQYIDLFKPYLAIVRNHHERYDGKGYPDGLKATEIPLLVRIITLADAFDAMTSDRSYRSCLSIDDALLEIVHNRGTQFDPRIVDIFLTNKIHAMV